MDRKLSQYLFNCFFLFAFIFFTFNFQLYFAPKALAATQVTLEWSPNTEPDLAGYRIFFREDGRTYDYSSPSWEGVETTCTIYSIDETKTYYFVARAYDTEGFESGDSNEVRLDPTIPPDNLPPSANAGPDQTVGEGQVVVLNGSNSTDPDDGIASYQWTQTGGPSITLSDSGGVQPTFIAPDVGPDGTALTFELTVLDYNGSQSKDICVVNVTWLNTPPQANAGSDQTASEGAQVTLDGSASLDIDDGIASYHWVQTDGPTVTLSDSYASRPTFTAPNVGPDGTSMTFDLTVTDTGGLQNSDRCIVNVSWQNEPPQAIVLDYIEAVEGTTVTLDGSGSIDPDDGIASYHWEQIGGTPVTLSDPGSATPTFVAPGTDVNGTNMVFRLTVTDFGGLQSSADGYVYITPQANELPIANAGEDQVVDEGTTVMLDGSNSSDPDGEIDAYQWTQISGAPVTLSDPASAQPSFIAPNVGPDGDTLTFRLTVTDAGGLQGTDTCSVTVNPEVQMDNVAVTTAKYNSKRKKLVVKATSDAVKNTVTLTAWANYGSQSIRLGSLKYFAKNKVYRKTFRRIDSPPDTLTVKSSGGGSDTRQCVVN